MRVKRPKPPKRIKVLHLTVEIQFANKFHGNATDAWGWWDTDNQMIFLLPTLTMEREREILFHEIGHIINEIMELGGASDEDITLRTAVSWMCVARDNPKLIEYLFNCKVNNEWQAQR